MTQPHDVIDNGSWPHALELFEQGDPAFVAEVRRITDADRLGDFAARWHADPRPAARRLLLAYLDLPLNAFRHEALVKRLFKHAERAGDDEVLGAFLVCFDRALRRRFGVRTIYASTTVSDAAAADDLVGKLRSEGFWANSYRHPKSATGGERIEVWRTWQAETLWGQNTGTMWRPTGTYAHGPQPVAEPVRRGMEQNRLFSLRTRRYLRRRAWRWFRRLGQQDPERYRTAIVAALKRYRDDDFANAAALLDNWGLVHALFHHSPVLAARPSGWRLARGRSLAQLAPAPYLEAVWQASPRSLFELLREAGCRPVRQWAVRMIRRHHVGALQGLTHEEVFGLLAHPDREVVELAIEVVRHLPDLAVLGVERLLALVEGPPGEALEILCGLLAAKLGANHVTLEQALRVAVRRPLPTAWLGLGWLQAKLPASAADCQALLRLLEAEAEPLRPEIVRWLRGVLAPSAWFQADWVLEYLDSRHADVRAEGWQWLRADERVRDDVAVWRKLLESPYDDVRLKLVADLEERVRRGAKNGLAGRLDDESLRFVWAAVLLNVHRGGRVKPVVVGQLARRLTERPDEAAQLLPVLAVALRSVRGPEWRAGLTAVVQAVERRPELRDRAREAFPELTLTSS